MSEHRRLGESQSSGLSDNTTKTSVNTKSVMQYDITDILLIKNTKAMLTQKVSNACLFACQMKLRRAGTQVLTFGYDNKSVKCSTLRHYVI